MDEMLIIELERTKRQRDEVLGALEDASMQRNEAIAEKDAISQAYWVLVEENIKLISMLKKSSTRRDGCFQRDNGGFEMDLGEFYSRL